MQTYNEVLDFWFPTHFEDDEASIMKQVEWWYRGGSDKAIIANYIPLFETASRNEIDHWAQEAHSRLALILILDQFPRSIYRDAPQAYAQDPKALKLALEGIENGQYHQLDSPWEKNFFMLPLGHSEVLQYLEQTVKLSEELVEEVPRDLKRIFEYSANQTRRHHDVIARFGRHPHRNAILGRESTAEELEYLAKEGPVHQRTFSQYGL